MLLFVLVGLFIFKYEYDLEKLAVIVTLKKPSYRGLYSFKQLQLTYKYQLLLGIAHLKYQVLPV